MARFVGNLVQAQVQVFKNRVLPDKAIYLIKIKILELPDCQFILYQYYDVKNTLETQLDFWLNRESST